MEHSVLSLLNTFIRRFRRGDSAPRSRRWLRGIPQKAGKFRLISCFAAFTCAAFLFVVGSALADEKAVTGRSGDRTHALMERLRAAQDRDNGVVRHGSITAAAENGISAVVNPADDGHWEHVGIPERAGHVAISDPRRDRMIVFGGDDNFLYRYDTWSLSMTDAHPWSKLAPAGPIPPQPQPGTGIYDPVRDRMLF